MSLATLAFSPSPFHYKKASCHLAGGDGDLGGGGGEGTVLQLEERLHGPPTRSEHEAEGHRHVDDDLTLGGLRSLLVEHHVGAAGVANPAGNVEETKAGDGELTEVLEVAVNDEVGEAVGAAEEASLAVVLETGLGLFDGVVEGEGRGRVGIILQATKI